LDLELIRQIRQRRVIGTPAQVKEQLLRLGEAYQADEILLNTPVHDPEARIRSYELIAEAFRLS
jgi:alkanesulfonate monooxygenase SsuD/methylene tetrahydromethanopterin reductase-like flavin-dependent oxidoreductase (luciferase family)